MNYQIIFSTYNNITKKAVSQRQLETDLISLAKRHNIQGFSLSSQTGYWAGELEKSYTLTLFDTPKQLAFAIAEEINSLYYQESSIVKPINEQVYFIDNPSWSNPNRPQGSK